MNINQRCVAAYENSPLLSKVRFHFFFEYYISPYIPLLTIYNCLCRSRITHMHADTPYRGSMRTISQITFGLYVLLALLLCHAPSPIHASYDEVDCNNIREPPVISVSCLLAVIIISGHIFFFFRRLKHISINKDTANNFI